MEEILILFVIQTTGAIVEQKADNLWFFLKP